VKNVLNEQILAQILNFNFLAYKYYVACSKEGDVNTKLHRFQNICRTVIKILLGFVQKKNCLNSTIHGSMKTII
jgi:hypothetical protein